MFWRMEEGEFRESFKDKVQSELSFEGEPGIGRVARKRTKNIEGISLASEYSKNTLPNFKGLNFYNLR